MKTFWLVKVHPEFHATDEDTGKTIVFYNWRENIVDVRASTIEEAKQVALLTGIKESIHYNDVVEVIGKVN